MCDLATDEVVIGRPKDGLKVDLDLTPDMAVSRPHARLWVQDGAVWIEDLASRFGTRIDDTPLLGRQALAKNSIVEMGFTRLRISLPENQRATWPEGAQAHCGEEAAASAESNLEIRAVMDARADLRDIIPDDPAAAYSNRRLALIYDLPLQFAGETSWDALLETIVKSLVEVIPDAARCTLLLDDRHGELMRRAAFPYDSDGVSKTLAIRAMKDCKGFIFRRSDEGDISHSVVLYGIETGMYAPLLWQGKALGAVCVDNPRRASLFRDDDLRLLLVVAQYAAMAVANQQLQRDLRDAWTSTLDALASALATRDSDTQTHCFRTVELAVVIARGMNVDEDEIPSIARGALLHDIGKIGISDQILFKPEGLTEEEKQVMREHVKLGYDMLKHIRFFNDALPVVLYHHEEYDGSGYMEGRRGDEIPLAARIFHVVDAYDALTHLRPYKAAWTHEDTMAELRKYAGTRYDAEVVGVLDRLPAEETHRIRTLKAFSPATRNLLGRAS